MEVKMEAAQAAGAPLEPEKPTIDYSLKEGETIHVNLAAKPARPQSGRGGNTFHRRILASRTHVGEDTLFFVEH
jgi:hypothetical protein